MYYDSQNAPLVPGFEPEWETPKKLCETSAFARHILANRYSHGQSSFAKFRRWRRRFWLENRRIKIERHRRRKENKKSSSEEGKKTRVSSNPVLSMLRLRMNHGDGLPPPYIQSKRTYIINVPKTFSLIDNPEESLSCLSSFLKIPRKSKALRIHFNHKDCTKFDLGANNVLDVCALMIRGEQRMRGKPYTFSGTLPTDVDAANLLKSMGITKHLKIDGVNPDKKFVDQMVQMDLIHGRRRVEDLSGRSDQEKVCTQLAEHLNNCFIRGSGFRLTELAQRQILKWSGEIITNAEEHSGNKDWYAMSFMVPCTPAGGGPPSVHECQLSIFGFGSTIYENLSGPDADEGMKNAVRRIVAMHSKGGWFRSGYSEESLWTLYALQDGVTSTGDNTRGRGTVDLIEAFEQLGRTKDGSHNPVMILLSGSTLITFDGRYMMREKQVPNGHRRIIAFNSENDLESPPDPKSVRSINGFFPGTFLGFRFYVDRSFLQSISEGARANKPQQHAS